MVSGLAQDVGCHWARGASYPNPSHSSPSRRSRSQIQIASRTFHFVLPPPAVLDDSPSPSSVFSIQRARSPSVDITSISPPSSLPSHSPSPRTAPALPPPKPPRSPDLQLPNSNSIPRTKTPAASASASLSATAPTSKKRKKASQSPPKPDVMPPKPPLTYAQLCYRAIKAMGGKATLQDICGWMMNNYDWYRYNEGAGWEVRRIPLCGIGTHLPSAFLALSLASLSSCFYWQIN